MKLEPIGLIEICMMAGVRRNTVSSWRARYPSFPAPWVELATGPVFRKHEVVRWLRVNGKRWDAGWTLEQVRESGFRGFRAVAEEPAP